jgi:flavorubredoxin
MSAILYESENHKVYLFSDLVTGDGVQTNQLFIVNDHHSALFDPGGNLTYQPLHMAISQVSSIKELDYVFATHQDPDIIASMDKWLMYTDAKIIVSKLWERFLPHLVSGYMKDQMKGRIVAVPDEGARINFGKSVIVALPAHFLHSVGNFHFYDPISKILFTGDVGASMVDEHLDTPVDDFEAHIPTMEGFHQRYMVSNKVCRLWVHMIRKMDIEMIVPQHGRHFKGKKMVNKFLDWFETLECGIDLFTQENYGAKYTQ